jgi:phosphate-selective porin OprO/OprP
MNHKDTTPQGRTVYPNSRLSHRIFKALPAGICTMSAIAAFSPIATAEESDGFAKLWDLATLHKDDANPILQEFKLRGRYHGQYHIVDGGQDTEDNWEDRRFRFGFDAKMFEKKVEVRVDFQSNDGFRDIYDGLVDAYVKWKPTDSFSVTVGRMKPQIGYYDFLQSTNAQPTFERSQIFNQLSIDRAAGIAFEGKMDSFTWQAGVYSNAIDTDRNDFDQAFGEFNGGWSSTLGVGYDFSKVLDVKKADFRIDWLHSERDPEAGVLNRYEDVISSTFWVQDGLWSAVAEGFYATGGQGTDGDVFGGFLQGTYDVLPKKLQLVGRYSFAYGDGDRSVRRQTRYESLVVDGRGNQYQAIYLGAQYFINGDKLKFLAGAEYADLSGGPSGRGYDGVTYLTGIRFSF